MRERDVALALVGNGSISGRGAEDFVIVLRFEGLAMALVLDW